MVLRHNSDLVPRPLQQAVNKPPYPTTPATPHPQKTSSTTGDIYTPQSTNHQASHMALPTNPDHQQRPGGESDSDSIGTGSDWDTDDEDQEATPEDLPAPLKIGDGQTKNSVSRNNQELPAALRVGPQGGLPRSSFEKQRLEDSTRTSSGPPTDGIREAITLQSHNPYLRMQSTGRSNYGGESSSSIWANEVPSSTKYGDSSFSPAELPADRAPVEQTAKLSLNDDPKSPYPTLNPGTPMSKQPPLIPVETEGEKDLRARHRSEASSTWDPGMDISSLDAFTSRNHGLPADGFADASQQIRRSWQEQQAWEQCERERKDRDAAIAAERARLEERERKAEEEWHKGEAEARFAATNIAVKEAVPPQLPPRRSQDDEPLPPQKPPRPSVDVTQAGTSSGRSEAETPSTTARRQRKEHYQIKHIHWHDASKGRLRPSPILIQNANGPCPLLALVNALVLSTPAGEETALIETLRTREQVSLGLLLDAVFDELMSGRRGSAAQELPDVGDLYAFLVTLHTGMNVNPVFVPSSSPAPNLMDADPGMLLGAHPAYRNSTRPGGFEETREMKLYSTFNIPLIHGWLPPSDSRAHAAFERSARTYEDAQNIQFREEELEAKLTSSGLNAEEQRLLEDVVSIKEFLTRWPTQLTDYGLQVIAKYLKPRQIVILFRNDHFSTLYKEPRSGQVLSLVTDAGYASHEEIVWESLVDVSGQRNELYSGDFRPVGGPSNSAVARQRSSSTTEPPIRSLLDIDDGQGWTTVQGNNRRKSNRTSGHANTSGASVLEPQENGVIGAINSVSTTLQPANINKSEQEDHDLALALQLQEEEEDRHRREQEARRRREDELSQEFLSQEQRNRGQRQEIRPLIPPRRSGPNARSNNTSDNPGSGDDAPPPTYEQAASGRPFHPPATHPANPNAPIRNAASRQSSAYAQQSSLYGGTMPPQAGNRRSSRHGTPLVDRIPSGTGTGFQKPNSASAGGMGYEDRGRCVLM